MGHSTKYTEWTPQEDEVLGTKPLTEVQKQLGRPQNQILQRMEELDIPHFIPADQTKLREGLDISLLVWGGSTILDASKELGIRYERARQSFHWFARILSHPSRLGRAVKSDEPYYLIKEIEQRVEKEIEENDRYRSVWEKPWPRPRKAQTPRINHCPQESDSNDQRRDTRQATHVLINDDNDPVGTAILLLNGQWRVTCFDPSVSDGNGYTVHSIDEACASLSKLLNIGVNVVE